MPMHVRSGALAAIFDRIRAGGDAPTVVFWL